MFPSSTLFHYPILLLLADKKVHTRNEMIAFEIERLSISTSDQKLIISSGVNKVASWTGYAIADLKNAGYIVHSEKGYVITEEGFAFFEQHKNGFVASDLRASRSYREYKRLDEYSRTKKNNNATSPTPLPDNKPNKIEPDKTTVVGVVYILTNPAFKTFYIKIGYTTNIEDRLRELYNTSVPLRFKVYALLKTTKYKQAEKMIHAAFKASRIGDDREFFMMKPEEALEQMKVVAEGLDAIVEIYDDNGNVKKTFDYSE